MKTLATLEKVQQHIDKVILHYLPKEDTDYSQLNNALRYTIFNGGKRLRPALVYFTGEMFGATLESLNPAACAVEMVHCFSLVHDDLPAMDNSDYRRGKPSCHKVFGEDVAILAGDTLLTLSLEVLSDIQNAPISHSVRLDLIHALCKATGAEGMVGGQIMDIKNSAKYNQRQLQKLHQLKTGALIKASILMGALCSPSPITPEIFQRLNNFADTLGLLYQVCDDILDVIADETLLGKATGTDQKLGKGTYVDLLELEGARQYASDLRHKACQALHLMEKSEPLQYIINYVYERTLAS
ncbi:MAG: polyprenyl synthetase family protein [Gammaproteobacteria bacterium]|nr:polyprenyl synthetase family protein [Gammaproteobacteria bacterium]